MELGRPLNGQVSGFGAFEDFVNISGGAAPQVSVIGVYDISPPACTNSGEEYIAGSLFLAANSTIRFNCSTRRASGKLIRACVCFS